MKECYSETVHTIFVDIMTGIASVAFLACALGILLSTPVCGQQVPPRAYQLQEYRSIAPSPLSNADRVRYDVIRATDPQTGAVNVRVLETPDVPGPAWTPGTPASVQALPTPDVSGPPWSPGAPASVRALPTPAVKGPPWGGPGFSGRK
jgi:hypothetical protein